MAIKRKALMPLIERLTEGREDLPEIIEEIDALDIEEDAEDWRAKYDALNATWTERYRKAVFRGEVDPALSPSTAEVVEQQEDETTPEKFEELFSEQEET